MENTIEVGDLVERINDGSEPCPVGTKWIVIEIDEDQICYADGLSSNRKNWRLVRKREKLENTIEVGDIVKRIAYGSTTCPIGDIKEITKIQFAENSLNDFLYYDGSLGSERKNWKLVKKSKDKMKNIIEVGDTVKRIKDGSRPCPIGSIFKVVNISSGYIYYDNKRSSYIDNWELVRKKNDSNPENINYEDSYYRKWQKIHDSGEEYELLDGEEWVNARNFDEEPIDYMKKGIKTKYRLMY